MFNIAIRSFLLLGLVGHAVSDYTPEALADKVENLPGSEKLDIKFNQFSGYLSVNGTKNLHYWMVIYFILIWDKCLFHCKK